jgi:zinc protease
MSRAAPRRSALRRATRQVRLRLDNGLVVLARRNPAARSVAVRLTLEAGSAFDPRGRAGLAALLSRLVDRGAGDLPAATIALGFDALGVAYGARARRDTFDFDARLLAGHLPFVLERLNLIAAEPALPEEEVRRERGQSLTAIAERDQDTAQVAEETLAAALYAEGHPYHAPALGTRESVEAIGRGDLAAFHRRRFGPAGAVLAIAGDVEPGAAADLAASIYGRWPRGEAGGTRAEIPDPAPPAATRVIIRPIPGKTQADIAIGVPPGLRRLAPDLPAALVLSNALGEFGLGGRLATAVRERGGMAYYAYTYFAAGLGPGPLVARAGVAPDKVARAAALMRRTIEKVRRSGLRPGEIADARQALASGVPRRLETNPGIASFLADSEFHGLGADYGERLPGLLRAVTRDQVQEAAEKYLDLSRHVLVVAGPEIQEEDLR